MLAIIYKNTRGAHAVKKISLTHLRADLYKIVDQVLATGIPVEIERRGQRLRIIAVTQKSKLENLEPHPGTIVGDPDNIVHLDWSHEWQEDENL